MPRAILALRRYPATMMLALVLFLATLVMTASSLGTVGNGGGDDGDGGSGIGGTGKSGEFGGSGFGGTGGPSPFFTSVNDTEQQENAAPNHVGDPAIAEVKTELAQALEQNAQTQEAQENLASVADSTQEVLVNEPEAAASLLLAEAPTLEQRPIDREDAPAEIAIAEAELPVVETVTHSRAELAVTASHAAEQETPAIVNAAAEPAALPSETMTVAHESEEKEPQETIERDNMPERIQRPDLPPFQRIRPVERPSLLPSRVQPMRI